MRITIDMMGQPCPKPVVEARKALAQPDTTDVLVLVDNLIAVQNLQKMSDGLGYQLSYVQNSETDYAVTIQKVDSGVAAVPAAAAPASSQTGNIVYFITADQLGISDTHPGRKLIKGFLYALSESPDVPEAILLVNTAVMLATDDSETLEDLKALEKRGTKILVCGDCIRYYEITDRLAAGSVSNMAEIVEVMTSAARTITI